MRIELRPPSEKVCRVWIGDYSRVRSSCTCSWSSVELQPPGEKAGRKVWARG